MVDLSEHLRDSARGGVEPADRTVLEQGVDLVAVRGADAGVDATGDGSARLSRGAQIDYLEHVVVKSRDRSPGVEATGLRIRRDRDGTERAVPSSQMMMCDGRTGAAGDRPRARRPRPAAPWSPRCRSRTPRHIGRAPGSRPPRRTPRSPGRTGVADRRAPRSASRPASQKRTYPWETGSGSGRSRTPVRASQTAGTSSCGAEHASLAALSTVQP